MAVETQDIAIRSGDHVVQFYEHDRDLVESVAPYLATAARVDEVAIMIATEAHRRAFVAELEAGGIDVEQASASGRFVALDAAETMAVFMLDGQVDQEAFHELVGGLVRKAQESGRSVRAYGEMVALLWDAGDVLAAIELERLWNELGRELQFSLFCSYPVACVSGSEHAEALHEVCHLHSCVLSGGSGEFDRPPEIELAAQFAAERHAPGEARRLLVAALRRWGHCETLVNDAGLVLSELASNAVRHADSTFSVAVRVEDSALHLAVHDAAPLPARACEERLTPQPGHGLAVIDAIATRWGVERTGDGKVVWAELRI